jgi:hypothetical protein
MISDQTIKINFWGRAYSNSLDGENDNEENVNITAKNFSDDKGKIISMIKKEIEKNLVNGARIQEIQIEFSDGGIRWNGFVRISDWIETKTPDDNFLYYIETIIRLSINRVINFQLHEYSKAKTWSIETQVSSSKDEKENSIKDANAKKEYPASANLIVRAVVFPLERLIH